MEKNTDELKVCYLCGEIKPRTEYYRGKNKINSRCKECDKKRRVEIRKGRKELEPHYKILLSLKGRIKSDFKKKNYIKMRNKTYEKIIGCDALILKEHLEKQFKDGMTWANHGEWVVDHIYPLGKSEDQDHYERNSHYTNLQPLWNDENMKKGSKLGYTLENKK